MAEVLRAEHRDPGGAAGPSDGRPQTVAGHAGKQRHLRVAVVPRRQPVEDGPPEVVRQADEASLLRLRDGRANEPRLALLVQITHGRSGQLGQPCPGRVEDVDGQPILRGQEADGRLDVVGDRPRRLDAFLEEGGVILCEASRRRVVRATIGEEGVEVEVFNAAGRRIDTYRQPGADFDPSLN